MNAQDEFENDCTNERLKEKMRNTSRFSIVKISKLMIH